MPVFEKNPDKSVSRLQKRLHQGMVMEVGQMYEIKDDNPMVKEFKTTKKELEKSKTELAGAILREKEVVKRYQRMVKRVHAFYVAAFHGKQGVKASDLLKLVTDSAQDLNNSISGPAPDAKNDKEDEKWKVHFQPAPKEDWKMSHEWREHDMETHINYSSAAALAILRTNSYDRIDKLETRLCLLCLSIFPDNYVLKKRLLIYWWIGEGIIVEQSNPDRTAEEVGEEIFEELIREGVIVARKEVGDEISEQLISEDGFVTRKGLGDELFEKLIKNGVIVAKKDQVGDETIREGVIVRKDYSDCPIVNRCSMNPWIRDMLVSVAREACFFDFDRSSKPLDSLAKSLRSCLVSCDPDSLLWRKNDPTAPPSGLDSEKDGSSSTRSFAKSCFPWLVSRHPNSPKEDSSSTPSDSSAKSCFSRLVSRHPNIPSSSSSRGLKKEDSSRTPSDFSANSCCSWLVSRDSNIPSLKKEDSSGTPSTKSHDQNIASASSTLTHDLKKEDSSGTPSTKSHDQNISSSSHGLKKEDSLGTPSTKSHDQNIISTSSSNHTLEKEGLSKDTPLYSFAKSWCSCLVSPNQDSKEEGPPEEKPKEEDVVSVFNVSENILAFEIDWLSKLKKIEVLQLGRWQYWCEHHIEVENDQIFKSLGSQKFLKYLSLRGISRISFLPASLSGLVNLEILDLKACHNLETLPDISSLKKLTHLDLSECYLLESMPEGIAKLTSLQVLKGFVIGNSARNTSSTSKHRTSKLQDLAKLKKLRKLSIVLQSSTVEDDKTLSEISSLRCLTITWSPKKPVQKRKGQETKEPNQEPLFKCCWYCSKEQETEGSLSKRETKKQLSNKELKEQASEKAVAFPLSLPKNLTKLDLRGFPLDKAPKWLNPIELKTLKKLFVRGGKLESLTIEDQVGNESWGIEILRLKFMENFKMELPDLEKTFPRMKYLEKVGCCDKDIIWSKGETVKGRDQDHIVLPVTAANKEKEGCDQDHNVLREGRTKFGEIEEMH